MSYAKKLLKQNHYVFSFVCLVYKITLVQSSLYVLVERNTSTGSIFMLQKIRKECHYVALISSHCHLNVRKQNNLISLSKCKEIRDLNLCKGSFLFLQTAINYLKLEFKNIKFWKFKRQEIFSGIKFAFLCEQT